MTPQNTEYTRGDEAMLATGLGLVLIGTAVAGFFETVFGSLHVSRRIAGNYVILHASFSPQLRAYTIAFGFLVLLVWGTFRFGRAVLN